VTGAALATRARGLASRLLPPEALDAIGRATDHRHVASELAGRGLPVAAVSEAGAAELDRAVAASETADLAILDRWDDGDGALAVLRDDSDRRTLRTIARAIAGRVAAGNRIGAAPTRSLPARTLAELGEATTAGAVATALRKVDHPYADLVGDGEPLEPLAFEHAMARRFHRRARRHARRDRAVARYVAQACDGDNAAAALLLAARGRELAPADFFLAGGDRIDEAAFAAAATSDPATARRRLATRLARTPLAGALAADAAPHALEEALVAWQLADQTDLVRLAPVSAAAILWLALRRRDEVRTLRRAIWRLALGGRP
jgi:hypothetical protein